MTLCRLARKSKRSRTRAAQETRETDDLQIAVLLLPELELALVLRRQARRELAARNAGAQALRVRLVQLCAARGDGFKREHGEADVADGEEAFALSAEQDRLTIAVEIGE